MENRQPRQPDRPDESHIVPPVARVPQVPPRYVTTQRCVYVVPSATKILLPDQLPQTPMPGQPTRQQRTCVASAGHQPQMDALLPQTPMPSANVFTSEIYDISLPAQPKNFPSRPPVTIAGSRSTQEGQSEYGIGETLLGCGMLIAIGIIALVLLYYISL